MKDLAKVITQKPSFEVININELDVKLYFQEDYIFKDIHSLDKFQKMIYEIFFTFYGVGPNAITPMLIDAITTKVKIKYPNLTFSQLKDCFYNQTIEKKEYVSISVDEFVKYIDFWDRKRRKIRLHFEQLEKEEAELEASKQKALEYDLECQEIYDQSVIAKKWLGNHFQASNFLNKNEDIRNSVSKEFKSRLWYICVIRYNYTLKLKKNGKETNYINKLLVVQPKYKMAMYLINKILKDENSRTR